jgi:hypothetical protein
VHSYLAPHRNGWHLRVHRLVTARAVIGAEGGFCVPLTTAGPDPAALHTTDELGVCGATANGLTSVIVDLHRVRTGELVVPFAGTNVLHPRTVLPMLRAEYPPGEHLILAAVYLGEEAPRLDEDAIAALHEGATSIRRGCDSRLPGPPG